MGVSVYVCVTVCVYSCATCCTLRAFQCNNNERTVLCFAITTTGPANHTDTHTHTQTHIQSHIKTHVSLLLLPAFLAAANSWAENQLLCVYIYLTPPLSSASSPVPCDACAVCTQHEAKLRVSRRQRDAYKIVVWRQTRFSRLTEFQLAGQKKSSWRAYGN